MTGSENRLLLDLAYLMFRRGPRIVVIAGATIGAALAYNALHGPSYTASMRVLVTPSAGTVSVSGDAAEPGTSAAATLVVQDHGQTARNQAELLGDPGLVRKVLPGLQGLAHDAVTPGPLDILAAKVGKTWRAAGEQLGLLSPASEAEQMQARISRALHVRAVGDTDVIKLDFTWNDRAFAARALNLIVDGYQHSIADTVEARDALRRATIRLAGAQAELATLDTALAASRSGATAPAGGQDKDGLTARLAASRATADGLRLAQELARRKLAASDQSYRTGGWVGADGQAAGSSKLSQSFADLLKQKAELAAATPPDADAMAAIDQKISQVRDQNYRHMRAQYSAELGAATDRLAPVETAIAADEASLRAFDSQQSVMRLLTAARPAKLAALADERRHVSEARTRIDAAWQEVGASRALSQAMPPAAPDFPGPAMLLQCACALGLGAGFTSAAWAERRRAVFERPADIARLLGIDVLARLDDLHTAPSR